jgi:hypothetical protein
MLQCIVPNKLRPFEGVVKYNFNIRFRHKIVPNTNLNICIINKDKIAYLTSLEYNDNYDDIYTLNGPDIEISNILISPSEGIVSIEDFTIDKVDNNYTKSYYFPFYDTIDANKIDNVACLTYDKYNKRYGGSGEKEVNDIEYNIIKEKIVTSTVELTLFGSLLTAYITSMEKGYAFALGGFLGTLYVKLLEIGVDNVGKQYLSLIFGQFTRLTFLFGLSASLIVKYNSKISEDKYIFVFGLLGFLVYHFAIILTYLPKNSIEEFNSDDTE